MAAARALKITYRQNMREQRKFDVFSTQLRPEKEMSLARQKRPPARFSGPAEAYQPTEVREHFKAEYAF